MKYRMTESLSDVDIAFWERFATAHSRLPWTFAEPHWNSMGLLEISRVTWQVCYCQATILVVKSLQLYYSDVIISAVPSQITGVPIGYSIVCSGADRRKSSASLAFVRGIHRSPVNSPHKGPVTRKMFPFDDVIMSSADQTHVRWWYLRLPNLQMSCKWFD